VYSKHAVKSALSNHRRDVRQTVAIQVEHFKLMGGQNLRRRKSASQALAAGDLSAVNAGQLPESAR